jgi:hypothetical protein
MAQENLMPDFTRSGPRPVQIAEDPSLNGTGRMRMEMATAKKGTPMNEQQVGGTAAGRAGSRGRWLNNPFGSRPTLRADAKGQLTLEFVKVVRNDLSDADLELAPARPSTPAPSSARNPAPEPAAGRGTAPLEPVEPEPSRWSRFTARLFGGVGTAG